ncbi:MAG: phosphate-starvation-inducible PsiE family protein [Limnoraphis sp. WC205]|nr:phosphate-starvation-inducible PsiE family protein [Limnoraphis sp. WC205]
MSKTSQASPVNWLNSGRIIRILETVQDLIIISLCIGLFSFMVMQLREMVLSLLPPVDFQRVTSDILYLLILVELFRLLIIYLQEHRVSIGVAVEVSIVSVLREIIVRGVLETPWTQTLATCAFLLVLTVLLVARVWLPPTFERIDPEQQISHLHKSRMVKENPENEVTFSKPLVNSGISREAQIYSANGHETLPEA